MDEEQNPNLDEQELDQEDRDEQSTGKEAETQPDPNQEEEEGEEISNDPVEEEDEQEEKPVSRRESKRIQQLLDKMAQGDEARFGQRNQNRPSSERRNGRPVIPEEEYDLEQINEMAQEYGQTLFQQGLSQAQAYNIANTFATRLEIDAPRVNSKYDFLDVESDNFNTGVASFVNRMYLNTVGYDPQSGVVQNMDLRYGEFVEGLMEVIDLISAGKVADNTRNVAQQAARTGIRPGGSRKTTYKGDDPRQMTDEQLEREIKAGLGI